MPAAKKMQLGCFDDLLANVGVPCRKVADINCLAHVCCQNRENKSTGADGKAHGSQRSGGQDTAERPARDWAMDCDKPKCCEPVRMNRSGCSSISLCRQESNSGTYCIDVAWEQW